MMQFVACNISKVELNISTFATDVHIVARKVGLCVRAFMILITLR